MERPIWLEHVRAYAIQRCERHDSAHDALHLGRVVANACRIVEAETAEGREIDVIVVEAACWLHDIVQLPKGSGVPGESARRSADEARELLAELGVSESRIDAICHAIQTHSFSGGLRPTAPEAAIVQDADRLDALGAVGIARLWVTGAMLGGLLYHPDDPAGSDRALDDRAYGLDHIERKLLTLPGTMNTEAARAEADRRAGVIREYRREFLREIGVTDVMLDSPL